MLPCGFCFPSDWEHMLKFASCFRSDSVHILLCGMHSQFDRAHILPCPSWFPMMIHMWDPCWQVPSHFQGFACARLHMCAHVRVITYVCACARDSLLLCIRACVLNPCAFVFDSDEHLRDSYRQGHALHWTATNGFCILGHDRLRPANEGQDQVCNPSNWIPLMISVYLCIGFDFLRPASKSQDWK